MHKHYQLSIPLFFILFTITFFGFAISDVGATNKSGAIASDETWTATGSPYIITGNLTINSGVKVTVEPGVDVLFDANKSMTINGELDAQGTATSTILFSTSATSSPNKGDWYYMLVGSNATATLSYATVEYGGGYTGYGMVQNGGGYLDIDNATISSSSFVGVRATGGTSEITSSTIQYINSHGLNVPGNAEIVLTDTHFEGSTGSAVNIAATAPFTHSGITASGNGINAFEMIGNITSDRTWTQDGIPYVSWSSLTVNAGYTLTLEPAVIVKLKSGSAITVSGALTASGTAETPVYITSIKDDDIGGDTNGDGASSGSAGDWYRLAVAGSADLHHTIVRYGGSSGSYGMLHNTGELSLEYGDVSYASYVGVRTNSGTTTVTNSDIHNNSYGFYISGGAVTVSTSTIQDNTNYGATKTGSPSAVMENNYWGASDGPSGSGPGSGDVVNANIDYDPFLDSDPLTTPTSFYAQIKNTASGRRFLRSSAEIVDTNHIMQLPEDWVVYVTSTVDASGSPIVADNYRWYQVVYKTESSTGEVIGWMEGQDASGTIDYLPYVSSSATRSDFEATSTSYVASSSRSTVIRNAMSHYYDDTSNASSMYSSAVGNNDLGILKNRGFASSVILAIAAQESADISGYEDFDNSIVSYDYGHGIMQITFNAWSSSTPNDTATYDNRGVGSFVSMGYDDGDFVCPAVATTTYVKCYQGGGSTSTLPKPYKHFDDNPNNPIYRQYSNTNQSIYANVKDGMRTLQEKFLAVLPNQITTSTDKYVPGYGTTTFDAVDRETITVTEAYNGINCGYVHNVATKLDKIDTYFTGVTTSSIATTTLRMHQAGQNELCATLHSPGDISIEDSRGRVVGVVEGESRNNFEWAIHDEDGKWAKVFFPDRSEIYTYNIVGTGDGVYGLDVVLTGRENSVVFHADENIPISVGELHSYSIDMLRLSRGEKGVTIRVDKDSNGQFEKVLTVGSIITGEDFH